MLKKINQLIMHPIVAFPVTDTNVLNILFSNSLISFTNIFKQTNKKELFFC